ncbi:ATPase [Saccharobesus litoralis]|uniref:ATPase n=1 Tax=Saccharobesus litoralis TaxID=2172099 RepID=A0A2S0VU80_9ALTE|nr:alpha/beta fold hydrolase [Saccharobesus litoralis]AWB67650.1 ATPase [Saccharobesus litoralis]
MAINRLEISNPEYTPDNTQVVTIHSSNLNRRHDISLYNVNAPGQDVPVVILMHGVYGNHWVWMHLGGLHKVYDDMQQQGLTDFVVVMPSDGGLMDGSGYLPLIEQGNYDGWIVEDVLAAVKQTVDCVTENSNVYISGLSMGGYGALRLGAKYPEIFKGISAHSSVTSLDDLQQFIDNPISDYQCQSSNEANIRYWLEKHKAILPPIRFDCGKDDSLFESNLSLEKFMLEQGIEHSFEAFSGGHEWPYWNEHVRKTLTFFAQIEKSS